MENALPSPDHLYAALVARDPAYEGRAWVGVTSTGIFCRLTCTARDPKPENCRFFASVAACLDAGFRACKRCRPLDAPAALDPAVADLVAALEAEPGRRWREDDLAARGLDPSTVRRAFRRHFGTTFLGMARAARLRAGAATLADGGRVIDAQLDAGFDSGSGFRAAFARLLGRAPAAAGDATLHADWIATPLGPMIAVADADALHLIEFHDRRALSAGLDRVARRGGGIAIGRRDPIEQVRAELDAYFAGGSARFATPLAIPEGGFTRTVWDALRAIPPGTTSSYGEVAVRVGAPTSVRAAARANGANRFAVLLPCHRVIGADGALTGYAGGLWRKRWLLDHERRHFTDDAPRAAA